MITDLTAKELLFHPYKYPGIYLRNHDEIKFLLWKNNTLGDFCSWALFCSDQKYYVRRVLLKQDGLFKLKDQITFGAEAILKQELALSLIDNVSILNINNNMHIEKNIYIDGIVNGIIMKNHEIQWTENDTEMDFRISKWHTECVIEFEKLFKNSNHEINLGLQYDQK